MAAVPAGALALPYGYVERAAEQEVADALTNLEEPRTPNIVVGMGGGGKSALVSAVLRMSSVREHFRQGIFWMRVRTGAKNNFLPLLQGLTRKMGAALTDTPHGVPHVLDSLEQVKQYLGAVASTDTFARLVVLDDVWEREVVDALLPLGLKGKYDEAEPLYKRSLAIDENVYGGDHPDVATNLNNLAGLLDRGRTWRRLHYWRRP